MGVRDPGAGADTRQILASVVRTARQRGRFDPRALIVTMHCAPEPVVPEALDPAACLTAGGGAGNHAPASRARAHTRPATPDRYPRSRAPLALRHPTPGRP